MPRRHLREMTVTISQTHRLTLRNNKGWSHEPPANKQRREIMKTNKASIFAVMALGGFVTFGTLAQAEDTNKPAKPPGDHQGGPGADMKERRAKMAEELGLSEDQKTKMADVQKEMGEKRKALREDTSLSEEEKRAKGKALREEADAKFKGILTAEQFEKWQKMQQTRRGPGGPGGPRGDHKPGEGKPLGDKPAKD